MDELDRRILEALQDGFPIEADPYARLAERLGGAAAGVDGDTVFARVMALCDSGLIRRLGPSWDSRRLGCVTTLVALRVGPDRAAEAAELVSRYDEVTHNYERGGSPWRIWFTLIAPSAERIETILAELRHELGLAPADMMNLPMQRRYKIDVRFPLR